MSPIQLYRESLVADNKRLIAGYAGISTGIAIIFLDQFANLEAEEQRLMVRADDQPDPADPNRTIFRRVLTHVKDGDVAVYYLVFNDNIDKES